MTDIKNKLFEDLSIYAMQCYMEGKVEGKKEALEPIRDLLNSNVSQVHLRRKLEEILNEVD